MSTKTLFKKYLLVVGFFLATSNAAIAAKIYVNPSTGNDSNSGSTAATAKATIQAAINAAASGDTIVLADGTYTEKITLGSQTSLTIASTFINDGNLAHIQACIMDGSSTSWTQTHITSSSTNLNLIGLTIKNVKGKIASISNNDISFKRVEITSLGDSTNKITTSIIARKAFIDSSKFYSIANIQRLISVTDSISFTNSGFNNNYCALVHNDFSGGNAALYFFNSEFKNNARKFGMNSTGDYIVLNVKKHYIERCVFYNNDNMTVIGGSGVGYQKYINNLFYKNSTAIARNAPESLDSVIIIHNTFVNNQTDMTFHPNGNWKGVFSNNLIYGSIRWDGPSPSDPNYIRLKLTGNYFKTFPTFPQVDTTGSSNNNTFTSVKFKDSANLNFTFDDEEPLLGSGQILANPITTDIYGNARPRPVGSKPEVGAFENALAAVPYQAVLSIPATNTTKVAMTPTLRWRSYNQATRYQLQLSKNNLFSGTFVKDTIVTDTFFVAGEAYNASFDNLKNGLVAYYKFNGNANDEKGTYNGIVNGAIPTKDRFGNSSSAYRFNGVDANIDLGTSLGNVTTTQPYTISLWSKGISDGRIIGKYIHDNVPACNFYFNTNLVTGNGTNNIQYTTPTGDWYHWVIVLQSGANNTKVYRNGVLLATGTLNYNTAATATTLYVGRLSGSLSQHFKGDIDDIRFYNRTLSSTEVSDLYKIENTSDGTGGKLEYNTDYYWRVRTGDATDFSPKWSTAFKFQTIVNKPSLDSINKLGSSIQLNWTHSPSTGVSKINIYRDTIGGWTSVQSMIQPMTSGWSQVINAVNPNKQYKLVVSGTWGIANGARHRDAAYQSSTGGDITGNVARTANRGCDANWLYEGACPPPVPDFPSGYATNNTYEYLIGSGKSGGRTISFTDGTYGDNSGSLTFELFESVSTTSTLLTSLASTNQNYTDQLPNGGTYFYKVSALTNSSVESELSNEIAVNILGKSKLVSPSAGSTLQPLKPIFKWNKYGGASSYQFVISTDSTFATTAVKDTTVADTTLTLPGNLVHNTTYFWRVRASVNGELSLWSDYFKLQTIVNRPLLDSVSKSSNIVKLNWTITPTSRISKVKISRDTISAWKSIQKETQAMNLAWSKVMNATDPNKKYKLVVTGTWGIANGTKHRDAAYQSSTGGDITGSVTRTANRGCDANWLYEGACPPPVPDFPSGYSSVNTYEYFIGTGKSGGRTISFTDGTYGDNSGSLVFELYESVSSSTIITKSVDIANSFAFDTLNQTGTYYYRLQAINNENSESDFSNEISIYVLAKVGLNAPENGKKNESLSPTLSWQSVPSATKYQLHVARDSAFSSPIFRDTVVASNSYIFGQVKTTSDATINNGLVSKYIFSGNANDIVGANNATVKGATLTSDRFGNPSQAYKFTGGDQEIDLGNSIANVTSSSSHTISIWANGTSGSLISKYQNLDASLSNFFIASTQVSGNGTNTINFAAPTTGWHHWVVIFASGTNNTKVYRDGVLLASGTLNYNANATVTKTYIGRLSSSIANRFVGDIDDVRIYNRVLTATEIADLYTIENTRPGDSLNLQENANYYWRVRSGDANTFSSWSDVNTFQTLITKPKLDSVIVNNKNAFIYWTKENKERVKDFKIYRSTTTGASTLIRTIDNSKTSFIDSALSDGKYYYRIKANNNDGIESDYSIEDSAVVITAVQLTSPVNNKKGEVLDPTLSWQANSIANTYQVQVSSDSSFTTSSLVDSVATTTSMKIVPRNTSKKLEENTNYYWRVRAGMGSKYGTWSGVSTFQTVVNRPVMDSVKSKDGFIQLDWSISKSTGIKQYKLYRDTSSASSNLITTLGVEVKTYKDSIRSAGKYFYSLRAVNTDDVESDVSNSVSVQLLAGPALLTPANRKTSEVLKPKLNWRKVVDAGSYQVQLSADSLFATTVKDTTLLDSSYAVVNNLEVNTDYYWRVRGRVVGGVPSSLNGFSAYQDFNGHRYFKYSSTVSWKRAKAICDSLNGYLVIPESADESNFIKNLAGGSLTWIGVTDEVSENKFYTVKGDTIRYSNWRTGSPDNFNDEDYVHIDENGKWNDGPNVYLLNFIIEFDINSKSDDIGLWSTASNFQTIVPAPNLSDIQSNSNAVTLKWDLGTSSTLDSVRVYRDTVSSPTTFIKSVGASEVSFVDSVIAFGKYFYRLKSVNNRGVESEFSNVDSILIVGATELSSPVNKKKREVLDPTLSWSGFKSANTYQVQVGTDSAFTQAKLVDTTISSTSIKIGSNSNAVKDSMLRIGLTAYYPFSGNANDESGKGVNGVITGATLTADRFGRAGRAYDFNGTSNYITVPDNANNELNQDFTISVWINPASGYGSGSAPNGDYCQILGKWGLGGVNNASYNLVVNKQGKLFTGIHNNNANYGIASSQVVPVNSWHHLVFKLEGTTMYLYYDNALIDTKTGVSRAQASNYAFDIGRETYGRYAYFKGKIDDIRLYQRALSTGEINDLYQLESTNPDQPVQKKLEENTNYYWRVRAGMGSKYGPWSGGYTFQTVVNKPVLDSVSSKDGFIQVDWSLAKSTGIKQFKLYRDTSSVAANLIATLGVDVKTYRDSVRTAGKYFYSLKTLNTDDVESDASNSVSVQLLSGPSLLTPTNRKTSEVLKPRLNWNKVLNAGSYQVQLSVDSLFKTTLKDTTTLDSSYAVVNNLEVNTDYYWRVRANNAQGVGLWSPVYNFQTYVQIPTIDSLTFDGNVVYLKWSVNPANRLSSFKITRDTTFTWKLISANTYSMRQAWSSILAAVDPSKQYKMVVKGIWGIANGVSHRDAAYQSTNGGLITGNVARSANRGCDANWLFDGKCPPPVPDFPSGYSSSNTYEYLLGNGISGGHSISFTDGGYNDNSGALTFELYESLGTTTTNIKNASSSERYILDTVPTATTFNYSVKSISVNGTESVASSVRSISVLGAPILKTPSDQKLAEILLPKLEYTRVVVAVRYQIQFGLDSSFSLGVILDTLTSDTSYIFKKTLETNTTYYWRTRAVSADGKGKWSSVFRFKTLVLKPELISVNPGNKVDTLTWKYTGVSGIKQFRIYRDTVTAPVKQIDTVGNNTLQYIDKGLVLGKKYFYRITAVNQDGTESEFSNELSGIPFNVKPKAAALTSKKIENVGEFNFVRLTYSSTGSTDADGKIAKHTWYVNDSLVNTTDSVLSYPFKQGTNDLKMIIEDNDGAADSSTAQIVLTSFVKKFKGGFQGGITAVNQNIIYTADTTVDELGAKVVRLDRAGNQVIELNVNSRIYTTPSVSVDSSVFITSGNTLYGFSKNAVPLWSTIPLGGNSFVTPTIDSILGQIYVGVSNKNFFAIDYKTGKVFWSYINDAPINTSAVVTGDRKLMYTTSSGTLYGYDINTTDPQTAPKWVYKFGDIVTKAPAIDKANDIYFGTDAGRIIKLELNDTTGVIVKWNKFYNSPITTSPVIDALGFVYFTNDRGELFKVDPKDGNVIWTRQMGGQIKSTPYITEYSTIIVATDNGKLTAVTTNNKPRWKYQDNAGVIANMLYVKGMVYFGNLKGDFTAIYDNPNSVAINTALSSSENTSYNADNVLSTLNSKGTSVDENGQVLNATNETQNTQIPAQEPQWGTFQGNFRRTGSKPLTCPDIPEVFYPNCLSTVDSIIVMTGSLKSKYWVINDIVNKTIVDTVLKVKPTDDLKVLAYNKYGCNVYSDQRKFIENSALPKPIIKTSKNNDSFCEGDSINLSISSKSTKYLWVDAAGEMKTKVDSTITVSNAGKYAVTVYNSFGCKATSDSINITMNKNPEAPAANPFIFCKATIPAPLSASVVSGNALRWYGTNATGGTASTTAPVPSTVASGKFDYFASQYVLATGCESPRTKISVTVNDLPPAPSLKDTAICQNSISVSLNGNSISGNTSRWYGLDSVGGTPTLTFIPPTESVGTYVYYASQVNTVTNCESPRSRITVSIRKTPVAPTVSAISICQNANGTPLTATGMGTNSFRWYGTNATGGSSSVTASIPSTSSAGSFDYYVSQVDAENGCESPRAKLSVAVNPAPGKPTVSRDASANLVSSSNNGNQWYREGVVITGAINQTYKPTDASNYTVKVTGSGGCVSLASEAYYYLSTALMNLENGQYVRFFPNPATNMLNLEYDITSSRRLKLVVSDINGRSVQEWSNLSTGSRLNLAGLLKGTYMLRLYTFDGKLIYISKLIKN